MKVVFITRYDVSKALFINPKSPSHISAFRQRTTLPIRLPIERKRTTKVEYFFLFFFIVNGNTLYFSRVPSLHCFFNLLFLYLLYNVQYNTIPICTSIQPVPMYKRMFVVLVKNVSSLLIPCNFRSNFIHSPFFSLLLKAHRYNTNIR